MYVYMCACWYMYTYKVLKVLIIRQKNIGMLQYYKVNMLKHLHIHTSFVFGPYIIEYELGN